MKPWKRDLKRICKLFFPVYMFASFAGLLLLVKKLAEKNMLLKAAARTLHEMKNNQQKTAAIIVEKDEYADVLNDFKSYVNSDPAK